MDKNIILTDLFNIICGTHDIDIIKYFELKISDIDYEKAIIQACCGNKLCVVKYLFSKILSPDFKNYEEKIIVDIFQHCTLDVVEFLFKNCNDIFNGVNSILICGVNDIYVVEFLFNIIPKMDSFYHYIYNVCEKKKWNNLNILIKYYGKSFSTQDIYKAFLVLCKNGNRDILSNFVERYNILELHKTYSKFNIYHVFYATLSNVDNMKYLIEKFNNDTYIDTYKKIFRQACYENKLGAIQLLLIKFPEFSSLDNFKNSYKKIENLEYLKFYLEIFSEITIDDVTEIFKCVCKKNELKLAKYLILKYPKIDISKIYIEMIKFLCSYQCCDFVKWFIRKFPNIFVSTFNGKILYYIESGPYILNDEMINLYKFIVEKIIELCPMISEFQKTYMLTGAIYENKPKLLEIIFEYFPKSYIDDNLQTMFYFACAYGYIEIAKLIKKEFPDFDHHFDDDACYKMTKCEKILEWLNTECYIPRFFIKAAID